MSKSDMSSAFRHLGILKKHWRYLVMLAKSPVDGKTYFFVDKCLPFDASISCSHFQAFSDAIPHIVQCKTGRDLLNYLDDVFFVALLTAICNQPVEVFLEVCKSINFSVSMEKTFWVTTMITFLGFLIDSVKQVISILVDKVEKARLLIMDMLSHRNVTVKQLQQICCFLNFAGLAVVPSHTFTRRLYMRLKGTSNMNPHHHLHLSAQLKEGLRM